MPNVGSQSGDFKTCAVSPRALESPRGERKTATSPRNSDYEGSPFATSPRAPRSTALVPNLDFNKGRLSDSEGADRGDDKNMPRSPRIILSNRYPIDFQHEIS